MESSFTYLDTYVLQKDMRLRLPKSILANLHIKKGQTLFDIYINNTTKELVLKVSGTNIEEENFEK
jgi:hypothetical protein